MSLNCEKKPENPHMHGENMQTPYGKAPAGIRMRTLLAVRITTELQFYNNQYKTLKHIKIRKKIKIKMDITQEKYFFRSEIKQVTDSASLISSGRLSSSVTAEASLL